MKDIAGVENFSEDCLQLACRHLLMVDRIIDTCGDMSLFEYSRTLTTTPGINSYQSRADLLRIVYNYTEPLLGERVAQKAVKDLDKYPVVLTANHHGVEYFSQTFQARLIFALQALQKGALTSTIPVFACGNIPLNNAVYPRGALIYKAAPEEFEKIPIKLPVFPDRQKRSIVSATPGFNSEMINRAWLKASQLVKDKKISSSVSDSLHNIFQKNYGSNSVVQLPAYSDQSVVVNYLIWKQLFPQIDTVPDSICLELEKIVTRLMEIDLSDPQTLLWFILFDPELRFHVLADLDGINGCWNRKTLEHQQSVISQNKLCKITQVKCGTTFFWGIDDKGRKVSLNIKTTNTNTLVLSGIDERGNLWEWPYSPESIINGISKGHLLPSGFSCYVVLLFARGLSCIGGYLQGIYLPAMKKGLVSALNKNQKYKHIADIVEQARADHYSDGMLAVMTKIDDKYLVPAGPLEIIAGGGITKSDINKMSKLTVREAHLADMFDTIPDAVPLKTLPHGWKKRLATDIYQSLRQKVVVK